MMKKKLLMLALLLAVLTSARAADGSLSVANVRNVVPGYSGSFDIVLTGADNTYCGYQFNLALPAGLTYTSYSNGAILSNHTADVTDHTTYLTFIGTSTLNTNFAPANGTLVTIHFTVSSEATGTLTGGSISTIRMADFGGTSFTLSDVNFSVPVGNTVDLYDTEAAAPAAVSNVDVKVNRALKANVWNTLVLPFDMTAEQVSSTFGTDVKVAAYNGNDAIYDDAEENIIGVSMKFESVSSITAHTPYIIKVTSEKENFTVSGVSITTTEEELKTAKGTTVKIMNKNVYFASDMIGTYETDTDIPEGMLYLKDNRFKFSKGTTKLKAFRAYFEIDDAAGIYDAGSSSAPAITIDLDGNTTAVSTVKSTVTDTEDICVNLQGQRVSHPSKGLYIVNGKKVIIK